jgi:hypothetical protein
MFRITDRSILWIIFIFGIAAQGIWKTFEPAPIAHARDLPNPPDAAWVSVWDMSEHAFASQWMALTLFSHDEQPGISLPYLALDYERITAWMGAALILDPDDHNILLAASQVYSQVPDPRRERIMLDFVHRQFLLAPESRWPYLAHAAVVARHRLNDSKLALNYARDLSIAKTAPAWVKQMPVLLLSDMGEREQARILLGGLVTSGAIRDEREIAFMLSRINPLAR